MTTNSEVLLLLAGLAQANIARTPNSLLFEAHISAGQLVLGTRNADGEVQQFQVKVEEWGEARRPSQHQAQSQEGTVEVVPANEGCCAGMQTCCKATEANPAQEELHGGCEEQSARDPSATEAPAI